MLLQNIIASMNKRLQILKLNNFETRNFMETRDMIVKLPTWFWLDCQEQIVLIKSNIRLALFDTQMLTCITDLDLMGKKICKNIKYRVKRKYA